MIDPLRYRSLDVQLDFDELKEPALCWQCMQQHRLSIPAFYFCHKCGKRNGARPFCKLCFFDYHKRKRGKESHKPHPIVRGEPVIMQTLVEGDGATFPKMHDWVTLGYTLAIDGSDIIIDDTYSTKSPLTFQSGCSGPCIHLQLLGCTHIAAADMLGSSDPYCAVYWNDGLVGVTTTKHMTLDPKWSNQTFVLPLTEDFIGALNDSGSSNFFNINAALPRLRIDVFDWDRLSKNDFLGQARLSDAELITILREQQSGHKDEDNVLSFSLMPKLSRGKLAIRVALRGQDLYLHIVRGEDLPRADPFSLSDPYCMVYWNGANVGKTMYVRNTLDPDWDREIFLIKVDAEGPNSISQSKLRVVCFDWDKYGTDDVLGHIELSGSQILDILEGVDDVRDRGGATSKRQQLGGHENTDVKLLNDFVRAFRRQERENMGPMIVNVPQGFWGQGRENELGDTEISPPQWQTDSHCQSHSTYVGGVQEDRKDEHLSEKGTAPQGRPTESHGDMKTGEASPAIASNIRYEQGWTDYYCSKEVDYSHHIEQGSGERGHEHLDRYRQPRWQEDVTSYTCAGNKECDARAARAERGDGRGETICPPEQALGPGHYGNGIVGDVGACDNHRLPSFIHAPSAAMEHVQGPGMRYTMSSAGVHPDGASITEPMSEGVLGQDKYVVGASREDAGSSAGAFREGEASRELMEKQALLFDDGNQRKLLASLERNWWCNTRRQREACPPQ